MNLKEFESQVRSFSIAQLHGLWSMPGLTNIDQKIVLRNEARRRMRSMNFGELESIDGISLREVAGPDSQIVLRNEARRRMRSMNFGELESIDGISLKEVAGPDSQKEMIKRETLRKLRSSGSLASDSLKSIPTKDLIVRIVEMIVEEVAEEIADELTQEIAVEIAKEFGGGD